MTRLGEQTIFGLGERQRTIDLGSGQFLLCVPKKAGGTKVKAGRDGSDHRVNKSLIAFRCAWNTRRPSSTISAKPDGVAAVSQARVAKADNFGLWPQSVRTPDALLCTRMTCLLHFWELPATIHRGFRIRSIDLGEEVAEIAREFGKSKRRRMYHGKIE
jgi:hypothetical protein